jgi:predicted ABC-class ATPase
MQRLRATLDRIDRKGYGAYNDLSGSHDFGSFILSVDRVQRDPFAPPSLVRIRTEENGFDRDLFADPVRRVAFEDFLTRNVEKACVETGALAGAGGSRYSLRPRSCSRAPR